MRITHVEEIITGHLGGLLVLEEELDLDSFTYTRLIMGSETSPRRIINTAHLSGDTSRNNNDFDTL
jgi:hypothetical protein